jgi:hypothetical protein
MIHSRHQQRLAVTPLAETLSDIQFLNNAWLVFSTYQRRVFDAK